MPSRSTLAAVLAAVFALSGVAGASAATKTHIVKPVTKVKVTSKKTTSTAAARKTGGTTVIHPVSTGPAVAMISAFPTGGKGSGTEATCGLWSEQLQTDQNAQDEATDKQDVIDTTNQLNTDVDNALEAGCAVIF
jgi:hypothetical protein